MTGSRLTTLLATTACASLLTGCVGSVHPLYIEGETVFREELVGEYPVHFHDGSPYILKVESIDDEAYRVTFPPDVWIMHLVELDGQLYLDLSPEPVEGETEGDVTPVDHIILHLRFEEDIPVTTIVNEEWLDAYLAEHPDELTVERMEGRTLLITASTEDLQRFVIAHGVEGLFSNPYEGTDLEEIYSGEVGWYRHDP